MFGHYVCGDSSQWSATSRYLLPLEPCFLQPNSRRGVLIVCQEPLFVRDPSPPGMDAEQDHIWDTQPPIPTFASDCDLPLRPLGHETFKSIRMPVYQFQISIASSDGLHVARIDELGKRGTRPIKRRLHYRDHSWRL